MITLEMIKLVAVFVIGCGVVLVFDSLFDKTEIGKMTSDEAFSKNPAKVTVDSIIESVKKGQ